MTTSDETSMEVLERKAMRMIYDALCVSDGEYLRRRRWNDEVYSGIGQVQIITRLSQASQVKAEKN